MKVLAALARLFVVLTVLGLAAAAVLSELGAIWWVGDLFSHFRFPYLAVAALALLVALLVRPRWRVLLVLAAAAPHAWAVWTYPVAPLGTQSDTGVRLRMVSANLLYTNPRLPAAIAWLKRSGADIICLQEIVRSHDPLVAGLRDSYPHIGPGHTRSDTLLLSRLPIVSQRVELPGEFLKKHRNPAPGEGLPYHVADVRTGGGIVRVICVHPLPPVVPRLIGQHRAHFAAWTVEAEIARKDGVPLVLLGDFNATPYSPRFRRLLTDARLRLAGPRLWWPWTWPIGGPLLAVTGMEALRDTIPGLPIDHVAVDRHFALIRHRRGPDVGADHYPIVVDLELTPPR